MHNNNNNNNICNMKNYIIFVNIKLIYFQFCIKNIIYLYVRILYTHTPLLSYSNNIKYLHKNIYMGSLYNKPEYKLYCKRYIFHIKQQEHKQIKGFL